MTLAPTCLRLLTDARLARELTGPIRDPVGLEPFWQWYDSPPKRPARR